MTQPPMPASSPPEILMVFCTVPDPDTGRKLARFLVDQRLAACVNVVTGLTSVYRWENAIEEDPECLLVIKTARARFDALRASLAEAHPYDVPEIIATPVVDGLPDYISWVGSECQADESAS